MDNEQYHHDSLSVISTGISPCAVQSYTLPSPSRVSNVHRLLSTVEALCVVALGGSGAVKACTQRGSSGGGDGRD